MWTQLVDASHLNRIGPETSHEPSASFVEREKRHAERLAELEKLRAARLADQAQKSRRRARAL